MVTIRIVDKVEPWPVNELDRAYGYDAAYAIANASGNILVGVASGGAGCWAKGAGTTGKIVGYGVKAMDIGGNVVGAGKNVYDIYDNGPSISNVVGLAGNGLGLAGNLKSACFTAGTQIVVGMEQIEDELGNLTTVYTTINIEDVQVGDLVYSYNTQTGEVELRAVTSTLAKTSDHINYLTIVDENGHEQGIETTDGHPFWVVTNDPDMNRAARDYIFENGSWLYHEDVTPTEHGYWVEAKDLQVGDVFLGANGELSTLTNLVRVEQDGGIAVFNFTVEGNHNYYILAKEYEYGQSCILVHNATWYHGTDSVSAQSIKEKGLNKAAWEKAADEIDKKGLSLTQDLTTAQAWADNRALLRGGTPVVLRADDSLLPKLHTDPLFADLGEKFIKPKDFPKVGPGIFGEVN